MTEATAEAGELAEAAQGAGGKLGKAAKLATAAAEQAQAALLKNIPDTARKTTERRFAPLHQLLDENGAPGPELSASLQALDALQLQLASLAHASAPEQAAFEMAKARMGGQRDAINQLRSSAARLPQPLGKWLGLLTEDSWSLVLTDAYHYLNQRYRNELYASYRGSLRERYPFSAHSASDVALADFREFFKAEAWRTVFERYLKPFVSGSAGEYQLRRVDGRGLPLSSSSGTDESGPDHSPQLLCREPQRAADPVQARPIRWIRASVAPTSASATSRWNTATGRSCRPRSAGRPKPTTDAPAVVEELGGRRVGIEKNTGPRSLFRLIDLMQVDYHSGRDVLMLKADLGGLRANYLLHAQRSPESVRSRAVARLQAAGDAVMNATACSWRSAARTDTGKVRARNRYLSRPATGRALGRGRRHGRTPERRPGQSPDHRAAGRAFEGRRSGRAAAGVAALSA